MRPFTLFRKIFFLSMALVLLYSSNVLGEDLKRVAILPFDIYSKSDVSALETGIMKNLTIQLLRSGRLSIITRDAFSSLVKGRELTKEAIWNVGDSIDADLVITGSLTRLGNSISVDVTTYDIKNRKIVGGIYAHGTGMASMGSISSTLAEQILLKNFREQRIEDIKFKGSTKIEDSAILNVIKSETGKVFSERTVSDDIKAIYKMGYFSDVRVEVSDGTEGKIITYILEEKPVITSIEITGNDEIDEDDIEELLTIKVKQILNPEKIKADIENIKAMYREKGYLNAEVSHEVKADGGKGVAVIFTITEHKKLKIEKITFEGNKAVTDDELKDMMEISEKGFFHFITDSGVLKMDKLQEDVSKLNAFYLNNGYINARVGEPQVTHDKDGIYIKIPLIEGKQFKVGKVEITGDMLSTPRIALLEKLNINKKDYFDRGAIMQDIDLLTQTCTNEGYAYANVTPQTIPHEKDETVDVIYSIEKGYKIYFNRITISGNTKTRDKVIRRELAVAEGDLYSGEKLRKSYMRLMQLRYFEEVNFQTEKGTGENLSDVNIQVKEKPTGMFSIGAGYSAQDQAVVMGQISQRNLFGRGQTLSLNGYLGSRTSNYEISFVEPWLFDRPLWSKSDLWNLQKEYDSYDLDTKGLRFTFGYPLFEYVKGYIGYEYTKDDIMNVADTASKYIRDQEGRTTTSGVTVTLTRDTTNDWMFPSQGSVNSASVRHTGTIFQGDNSFTKYVGNSSWFFPLPLENVFALRGRIGYVEGHEGKEIPVYERFVLGGMRSLRGLRDVGPVDPETGDVIGGKTMLVFQFELIFPLIKDAGMKGVLFYDTGNAWESGYHLDDLRQTAGLGVRWYSPIGPLRLEWGYVLDRKEGESTTKWEFTIGMMM